MLKRLPFIILLFISNSLLSQVPEGTWSVNPYPFSESQQIIITVKDINNGNLSGVNEIYLWTWYTKLNGEDPNSDSSWNGEWSASKESMKMQSNGDGSYSYTYTPSTFYDDTGIGTIGVVHVYRTQDISYNLEKRYLGSLCISIQRRAFGVFGF